jgi:crotonobetainyl-CoA:carnitine CoA-transferase CaiB-like acyl-CoA transferase
MKARPSAEWLERFEAHGVPAGPIYRMDEVFADPQVRHLGIAEPVSHPETGDMELVGQPVTLSRTPAAIVSPIPDKGGHTDDILAAAGFQPSEIADLRRAGVI